MTTTTLCPRDNCPLPTPHIHRWVRKDLLTLSCGSGDHGVCQNLGGRIVGKVGNAYHLTTLSCDCVCHDREE